MASATGKQFLNLATETPKHASIRAGSAVSYYLFFSPNCNVDKEQAGSDHRERRRPMSASLNTGARKDRKENTARYLCRSR